MYGDKYKSCSSHHQPVAAEIPKYFTQSHDKFHVFKQHPKKHDPNPHFGAWHPDFWFPKATFLLSKSTFFVA